MTFRTSFIYFNLSVIFTTDTLKCSLQKNKDTYTFPIFTKRFINVSQNNKICMITGEYPDLL